MDGGQLDPVTHSFGRPAQNLEGAGDSWEIEVIREGEEDSIPDVALMRLGRILVACRTIGQSLPGHGCDVRAATGKLKEYATEAAS